MFLFLKLWCTILSKHLAIIIQFIFMYINLLFFCLIGLFFYNFLPAHSSSKITLKIYFIKGNDLIALLNSILVLLHFEIAQGYVQHCWNIVMMLLVDVLSIMMNCFCEVVFFVVVITYLFLWFYGCSWGRLVLALFLLLHLLFIDVYKLSLLLILENCNTNNYAFFIFKM